MTSTMCPVLMLVLLAPSSLAATPGCAADFGAEAPDDEAVSLLQKDLQVSLKDSGASAEAHSSAAVGGPRDLASFKAQAAAMYRRAGARPAAHAGASSEHQAVLDRATALKNGNRDAPAAGAPGGIVWSFSPDSGTVCFEGPPDRVTEALATVRKTSLGGLFTSTTAFGISCSDRGYPTLRDELNECFLHLTTFLREDSEQEDMSAWVTGVQATWAAFDREHALPNNTAMTWFSCHCDEESTSREDGVHKARDIYLLDHVYGEDIGAEETAQEDHDFCIWFVHANLTYPPAFPYPRMGSFIPDNGFVCFQGAVDYLEASLAAVRRTPTGLLYLNSAVTTETCLDRGYDILRDLTNECWPSAGTFMRSATEPEDIQGWVDAQFGGWIAYDEEHSLPDRTALHWNSCVACVPSSRVQANGLWKTGSALIQDGYSAELCDFVREQTANLTVPFPSMVGVNAAAGPEESVGSAA